jgi:copper resistance protein B
MTVHAAARATPRRCVGSRYAFILALLPLAGAAAQDDDVAPNAAGHVAPTAPTNAMPEMPYPQMAAMMDMDDSSRFGRILVDQWEWREGGGARSGVWDAQGWYGDDYNKLLGRSEGDWPTGAGAQGRAELLWDRIVTRWWSLQGGVRYDFGAGPGKGWAALGVQGLAPYWINVEATLYVGSAGAVATRLKAETDLRFTQRLILQPELELNAYARPDRARQQGAGLSPLDAGLRLRYEIRRELAPYLGLAWLQRWGESAQSPRAAGAAPGQLQWLLGVRFWY